MRTFSFSLFLALLLLAGGCASHPHKYFASSRVSIDPSSGYALSSGTRIVFLLTIRDVREHMVSEQHGVMCTGILPGCYPPRFPPSELLIEINPAALVAQEEIVVPSEEAKAYRNVVSAERYQSDQLSGTITVVELHDNSARLMIHLKDGSGDKRWQYHGENDFVRAENGSVPDR
jgi:hypothetical protein